MKNQIILKKVHDEKMLNALNAAIKEAEGKARERKLHYYDIFSYLEKVEQKLSITKKAMEGTEVVINVNAQDFPKAYKWIPESTFFDAIFLRGTWRITRIYRDKCGNVPGLIKLSETAKKAIIANHIFIR